MSETSSNISADFLAASTPQKLRRLLFELQNSLGGQIKIITIQFDGTNWVVWFYNDLNDLMLTEAFRKKRGG